MGMGMLTVGHTSGILLMNSLISSTGSSPTSASVPNIKLACIPGMYLPIILKCSTTCFSLSRPVFFPTLVLYEYSDQDSTPGAT